MTSCESTPEEAYHDRNLAIQAAAMMAEKLGYRVGVKDDPEWPILYIDLPTGQVSWHLPSSELVRNFPSYIGEWDRHDVMEKRRRIIRFLDTGLDTKMSFGGE